MAREVVAVPTRGVERWLSQRLSHRLGATPRRKRRRVRQYRFPVPGRVPRYDGRGLGSGRRCRGRCRQAQSPAADPWSPERSVWPLLQLVDEHLDDELMWPLAAHLRASSPAVPGKGPRRFAAVRHMADLFDQLCSPPPGHAAGLEERGTTRLTFFGPPGDMAWQAELWRHLRDASASQPGRAFQRRPSPHRGRARPARPPERVSVFGLTRLPTSHLGVLKAYRRPPRRTPLLAPPLGGPLGRNGLEICRTRRRPACSGQTTRRPVALQPVVALLGARRPRDAARAGGRRA